MATRAKKKTSKKKATKKTKTTKKVGCPTKYDPKFCEDVIEQMAKGYSKEAVAGYLGISKDTLYRWIKEHKEFSDAVHIGETKSQFLWESKAVDYSVHTKDGKRLDSRIYSLQMKNRFNWTDKKEIELGEETSKKFAFTLDQKSSHEK
jgi:transposase-like protein